MIDGIAWLTIMVAIAFAAWALWEILDDD